MTIKESNWVPVDFPDLPDLQVMVDANADPSAPQDERFKFRPWVYTGQIETPYTAGFPPPPAPPPKRPSVFWGMVRAAVLFVVVCLAWSATQP